MCHVERHRRRGVSVSWAANEAGSARACGVAEQAAGRRRGRPRKCEVSLTERFEGAITSQEPDGGPPAPMLSPATVGSAQDAERLLDVTVQFAHFFVSGGCGIGPLAEAERYKVPASRTCQQLKEQMMAETKHLWDGAPAFICAFLSAILSPRLTLRICLLLRTLTLSTVHGACYLRHATHQITSHASAPR